MLKVIISGFGGQGVLTMGQILADMALHAGKEVTWMPSYGAEMRGGTANCAVIIADKPIGSPIVLGNVDILCALNTPSVDKFLPRMRAGGHAIINSSIVTKMPENGDFAITPVDATNLAMQAGNARATNMAMLAGLLKINNIFQIDDVRAALKRRFDGRDDLVDLNMKVMEMV